MATTSTADITSTNGSYSITWGGNAHQVALEEKVGSGGTWTQLEYAQGYQEYTRNFSNKANGQYFYRTHLQFGFPINQSFYTDPIEVIVAVVPSMPSSLTISPSTSYNGSHTVSWGASTGIVSHYQLEQKIGSGAFTTQYTGGGTSRVFSGLGVNSYAYRVRACHTVSSFTACSDWRSSAVVTVSQPAAPTLTTPAVDADGVYTVTWTASTGAASYTLQRRFNNSGWSTLQNNGNTAWSEQGLANGQYDYRVRACSSLGCSAYSAIKETYVGQGDLPPAPPPAPVLAQAPALTDPAVVASDQVGTSTGNFRVDESGAATYHMPIVAAAGTAGVVPEIALNYSSQAGNGLLGKGWMIGGLSAVTRCRQTLQHEGQAQPLRWDGDDRFCLDGQRLMAVSGSYGAPDSVYRTEIDTQSVVTARGGSAGHPDYFVVEHKDGSVAYYGNTPGGSFADAKQNNGAGQTLAWSIKRRQDSVGNAIWFFYANDVAGQRISEVRYAYGANAGPANYGARIVFDYENRPDTIRGYVAGHAFTTARRLNTITSYNLGTVIRTYQLGYEATNSVNSTSRLNSVQECLGSTCLPATVFSWPAHQFGFSQTASGSITMSRQFDRTVASYNHADINGDGNMDLVWLEPDYDGNRISDQYFRFALSNGTSFEPDQQFYANGANVTEAFKWHIIDYNGDGRDDVIVFDNQKWMVFLSTPQADGSWRLGTVPINTPLTSEETVFMDANSDGLVDAVYIANGNLYIRYLEHDPSEVETSSRYYAFGPQRTLVSDLLATYGPGIYSITGGFEFNGDGVSDLWLQSNFSFGLPGAGGTILSYYALTLDGTVSAPQTYFQYTTQGSDPAMLSVRPVDLNGDGLSDLFYDGYENGGQSNNTWYYRINTGAGFGPAQSFGVLPSYRKAQLQFADHNGDGATDVFWLDTESDNVWMRPWNGAGFDAAISMHDTSVSISPAYRFVDLNGDGRLDKTSLVNDRLVTFLGHSAQADKIESITNGLGNRLEIHYGSLAQTTHYDRLTVSTSQICDEITIFNQVIPYCYTSPAPFYQALNGPWDLPAGSQTLGKTSPVLELMAPVYVVTQVAGSAPVPGNTQAQSHIDYYYGEAKLQAGGRGILGFHRLRSVDRQTGVETTTTYRQDFPFTGRPENTQVRSAEGHLLSEVNNTWELENWNNGNPPAPYQLFLAESVEETYSLVNNGATPGDIFRKIVTTYIYDDYNGDGVADSNALYGNPTDIVVQHYDAGNALVSTQTTENDYGASDWDKRFGRLSYTEVTTVRGSLSTTRRSAFTYYGGGIHEGLLRTEVIEPGDPAYALTTTYEYDSFGNKTKSTQSGANVANRVSVAVFDSRGRHRDQVTNVYGQVTEQILARNSFGQPTIVTDINGVETHITYGALGRQYFEAGETGNYRQTLWSLCDFTCPSDAVYLTTTVEAGGRQSRMYFDRLARRVRVSTLQFDGTWGHIDTEYDNLGRVKRQSEPHSGVANYWTVFGYDLLGRVIRTDLPDAANPVTVSYAGLTTVTTNPLGQTKTDIKNVLGELVSVYDHLGGQISFDYDAVGNVLTTTNHGGPGDPHTIMITTTYDKLSRKVGMNDPDKGQWSYQYNVFGELIAQTDAKNQTRTMTYDQLGRLVNRVDKRADNSVESNSTWTYNNATTGGALGALLGVEDSVSGYIEMIGYDGFGRLDDTVKQFAANDAHYEKITYDEYGRIFQEFDAAGDGTWQNHAVEHKYNVYGYLNAVVDAVISGGQPKTQYYIVQSMDLRGNVTEYMSGNGITRTASYDPAGGRLIGLKADRLLGGNVQDHTYSWDDIGNLINRHDQSGAKNVNESFQYDGLNRLTRSQVAGQAAKTVSYNSLGNIVFKTGVGAYTYGAGSAGPHAVTSTGDGVGYSYDANGNMTSDSAVGDFGGRTITYTTFDKPATISKGGHTTAFTYGPSRARYLRVDTDSNGTTTTRYIGRVEKITRPNGTREVKRYLPGDVLITLYRDSSGFQTGRATHYIYKDHLGSVDVITDAVGAVGKTMSFDAWGQRRAAVDWEDLTTTSLLNFDHSITTRGYTGHEMLDESGLIHMNGRIYDPRLGRFVQADTVIQFPDMTQSYNRYSYVLNNPTKYTDPSGHIIPLIVGIAAYAAGANLAVAALWVGIASFAQTLMQGGSLRQALTAGVSAFAMSYIGGNLLPPGTTPGFTEVVAMGTLGGVTSALQGGKFGHGFVSAGLGSTLGGQLGNSLGKSIGNQFVGRLIGAAVMGGTVSTVTGGKFANGAAYAAFAAALQGLSTTDDPPDVPPSDNKRRQLSPLSEEQIEEIDRRLDIVRKDLLNKSFGSGEDGTKAAALALDQSEVLTSISEDFGVEPWAVVSGDNSTISAIGSAYKPGHAYGSTRALLLSPKSHTIWHRHPSGHSLHNGDLATAIASRPRYNVFASGSDRLQGVFIKTDTAPYKIHTYMDGRWRNDIDIYRPR
ncbi:FG-GAP-like repeat-containing protein [Exilibacterium tricleocarpae]|nr:RHS repeat-associated core domain-containing protein [Exilibacterium tricleocarpae]